MAQIHRAAAEDTLTTIKAAVDRLLTDKTVKDDEADRITAEVVLAAAAALLLPLASIADSLAKIAARPA